MIRSLFRRLFRGDLPPDAHGRPQQGPHQQRRRDFVKSLDGRLPSPEQVRLLGELLMEALLEIRNSQDPQRTRALADALHNLPLAMHCDWFRWSVLLAELEAYERLQPQSGARYI